jgi:transposase
VLSEGGQTVEITQAPPDGDGLRGLGERLARHGETIYAAIESMNGARFVHDQLERVGWTVEVADAVRVKGLAPLACKTDKIDAWVLAELCRRDLVPAIWLPTPQVRADRELARWRLHLVRHRVALKNRIHAILIAFGHPCPVSDLFGVDGRRRLEQMKLPERWAGDVHAALRAYHDHYHATKQRLGRQRGSKVARVELARSITEAIWHMLTKHQDFRPAGPTLALVA